MKYIFVLASCFFLVNFIYAQEIQYGNNPNVGKYYDVRGVKIYVEEYGKGKPLVLLHGNGGDISAFGLILPYFSERYRTIAVDSRAHGKSVDKGDSLSFEMMADDVAALLDQMKIESAFVIGWSDGGIIAIDMAIRHPEKVIKLASTGANLWPDSTALMPNVWAEMDDYYKTQKDNQRLTDDEKNSWKVFMLDWEQPNISLASLRNIKTPSLIIAGDHDLIRLEHTVQIFQNIPNAQLWILPNSGHDTFIKYPKEFCEKVDQFFSLNK